MKIKQETCTDQRWNHKQNLKSFKMNNNEKCNIPKFGDALLKRTYHLKTNINKV